jgi:NDP-sugar pyrophosphorylase family protein
MKMNVVIPMAGLGTRFTSHGFTVPKHLLPVDRYGTTMIETAVSTLQVPDVKACRLVIIVLSSTMDERLKRVVAKWQTEFGEVCVVEVDKVTQGPACSVLAAAHIIDTDEPLVISNCDQALDWDARRFWDECARSDGCLLTQILRGDDAKPVGSSDHRSYALVDGETGRVTRTAEKIVLSSQTLVGTHYVARGSDFVKAARAMIEHNDRAPNGEFYVSHVYNWLLREHLRITTVVLVEDEVFWCVGSADDYFRFWRTKHGQQIVRGNLCQTVRGWFIGDFEPSFLRTPGVEVGVLTHQAGEKWTPHVHEHCDEYNVLLDGSMTINGVPIARHDVFTFLRGAPSAPTFLTDCRVLCIKLPSVPGDKVLL